MFCVFPNMGIRYDYLDTSKKLAPPIKRRAFFFYIKKISLAGAFYQKQDVKTENFYIKSMGVGICISQRLRYLWGK